MPTPGGRNTEVVMGDLGPVQFSHQRSMCESPFRLVLTNASPPAVIYYTTDGTIPTSTTALRYQRPIAIGSTTVVRAAAFQPRMRRSLVSKKNIPVGTEITENMLLVRYRQQDFLQDILIMLWVRKLEKIYQPIH